MSVVALEAQALRRCLTDGPVRLGTRFFAATAATVDAAWQLATAADLAVPEVPGRRTPAMRFGAWYTNRLIARCMSDITLFERFVRVTQLLEPPPTLFAPRWRAGSFCLSPPARLRDVRRPPRNPR